MKSIKQNCIDDFNEFIPEPDTVICKYMDFPKFINLIDFGRLHFTRADRFKDELEGTVPLRLGEIYGEFDKYRKRTFINCWSRFDSESYAMWQIYSRKYGIAIRTSVEKLKKSLRGSGADIWKVKYVDYNKCSGDIKLPVIKEAEGKQVYNFFVLKPNFYEYEREVRAIITTDEERQYIDADVDIDYLIEEIIITPFSSRWFSNLVKDLIHNRFGMYSIKIQSSDVEINR